MSYTITCDKCKTAVEHICNESFKKALLHLLRWVPEGMFSSEEMAKAFKEESKRQGDSFDFSKEPFFGSQAWTYLIWYKEDARSFHGVLNNLIRAAGFDPYEIEREACKDSE